ncbi:PTS IIA-like nitrogen regulatory protein PtsN [Natronospira bacteriovora]|uniref:PTS IIA-like nitrogen regulatory protein PtsN n=1 Tax=Natronospira bacteriovora TaxID=3069753 RepID=A0ABU0W6B2_9GAMM|nr:PTS IIA-like nitrogen regulatory protein PtsN [Natronospira sp. AB-CW4]MDQ2069541.1 PTS IIA-like nitrogen regulatory protein PtsN [Natronospira sp. AB-CW4]
MTIRDLIAPERISTATEVGGKKRALEMLSDLLASSGEELSRGEIFTSMINRERLGSTAIGSGVAIPHGRIEGLRNSMGAFIRLQDPIDFDATDGAPVDMMFALIVPTQCAEEHLNALAALARMFSRSDLCDQLRLAESPDAIYELLISSEADDQQQATA